MACPGADPASPGWMGHASVEESEGYLNWDRAPHAQAANPLDAYVPV